MDLQFQPNTMDMDFVNSPYSTASSPFDSAVRDMDLPTFSLPTPLDPPSREDWEAYKTIILEQYVGMNMTVKELVSHMDMWYQFRATPRMFKQRFTEWGVFKYAAAARRRMTPSSNSFTSAPVQLSTSAPSDITSAAMSRVSSATSYDSSFSQPYMDEAPQYNSNWGCMQDGPCSQANVCAHRHCIQSVLSNLEQRSQHIPTSHPTSVPSPYSQQTPQRRGSVENVLYYVEQYSESWMSPQATHQPQIPDAAAQARQLVSGITNHCSHKTGNQCERCTWAEFDFGLAMLEDGRADLAMTSFELGCRLSRLLLSQPSKLFIRNLVMAFGSSRWQRFEAFREKLLTFLALMANTVLGDEHPIAIILHHVSTGDTLVACSELALRAMITTFEKTNRAAHPDVLLVKRSLSVILRRQQQFSVGEKLLLSAIHDSENENGVNHKETRRCLRRLGHLYMQQQRWDEAEAVFLRILDSAPGLKQPQTQASSSSQTYGLGQQSASTAWIPDEISVYTYQHLAQLSNDRGDTEQTRIWFAKELEAALKRWGPGGEYTAECLSLMVSQHSTPPETLSYVVEQYPEILQTARALRLNIDGTDGAACGSEANVMVSKARWCAVRNLI